MLQGANTEIFNPLVLKAHNGSECQNLLFSLHIMSVKGSSKLNWRIFIFAPSSGTNGLKLEHDDQVKSIDDSLDISLNCSNYFLNKSMNNLTWGSKTN